MLRGILSIDEGTLGYPLGVLSAAAEDDRADITAGSLKVTESRRIANLLVIRLIP